MSKAKRRPVASHPLVVQRSRSPFLWGAVVVEIVLAGVAVILVARGSTAKRAPAPVGTETFSEANRSHVQGTVSYDRKPPAGGNHAAALLNCGIYDQPVPPESAVHSLEHGAVWVMYDPALAVQSVDTLRRLVGSKDGSGSRYVLLSPYPGNPTPVVATAWGNQLKVQDPSDPPLGQFIDYFRKGPQDLEPGAPCSGGTGNPIE